jgi:Holliday junction resolvasome RuvABC endonuclease subunit
MKILALDPAEQCGFAYYDGQRASGVWNLKPKSNESKGMKLINLRQKLQKIHALGIDLMVWERPAGRFKQDIVSHAELQGVLKLWCETHGIDYRTYSPSEIKLHATGKGTAKKSDMVQQAVLKYGMEGNDHNEADAVCLLHLTLDEYDPPPPGAAR